ncbi:MAG: hypothetical protein IJ553_00135 [Alloprevotella sp.]|nr:hypothetical protein [Alloprevotella sp.]
MILIENEHLQALFTAHGAELVSLKSTHNQKEYLWQGDPEYWNGHSPILFPITGGLWNGETRIDGTVYRIPKHGFVQKQVWDVETVGPDHVTFVHSVTDEESKVFPYNYTVRVAYSFDENKLVAHFEVENRGDKPMYFQMGGHPAIALPDFQPGSKADGFLQLEGKPTHLLRAGEQGCIEMDGETPAHFDIPADKDGLVPVCEPTFANEALIFDEQLSGALVLNLKHQPLARVTSSAPVWLFWSPQGKQSPFVCLEPWYGLPDLQHFSGPIEQRAYIQKADPKAVWQGYYAVEIFHN